jgi:hypothetical protein
LGEGVTGFPFQFLGAGAQKLYPATKALGANLRDWCSVVTLMADQNILGKMIGEGNLAPLTAEDEATTPALNKGSPSPPIKK